MIALVLHHDSEMVPFVMRTPREGIFCLTSAYNCHIGIATGLSIYFAAYKPIIRVITNISHRYWGFVFSSLGQTLARHSRQNDRP